MTTIRAFFSPNWGTFFQFSEKGRETSPPPPSSYGPDIETSQLICRANQLTGLYMMTTLVFKELMDSM